MVGNKILLHFLEKLEVRYYFTLNIRLASSFVSHEHLSYFEEQRYNILNLVLLKYVRFLKNLDICLSSRVIILLTDFALLIFPKHIVFVRIQMQDKHAFLLTHMSRYIIYIIP